MWWRGLIWYPKIHHRVHNSPQPVPFLSQMNPVHTFPPCFPKIHSNIILLFTPRSSQWHISFRFYDHNFARISHLTHANYMSRPCRSHNIGEVYKLRSSSLCSLLQPLVTSSLLRPNILPDVLTKHQDFVVVIFFLKCIYFSPLQWEVTREARIMTWMPRMRRCFSQGDVTSSIVARFTDCRLLLLLRGPCGTWRDSRDENMNGCY
jgi:hypothetical protein